MSLITPGLGVTYGLAQGGEGAPPGALAGVSYGTGTATATLAVTSGQAPSSGGRLVGLPLPKYDTTVVDLSGAAYGIGSATATAVTSDRWAEFTAAHNLFVLLEAS